LDPYFGGMSRRIFVAFLTVLVGIAIAYLYSPSITTTLPLDLFNSIYKSSSTSQNDTMAAAAISRSVVKKVLAVETSEVCTVFFQGDK
jgi:hypothetical protein